MAQVTGTFATNDAVGNREDLTDFIYNITPDETPLLSAIGRSKARAIRHEWQTDSLATPSTSNAQIEGRDYAFETPASTTRVSNICQISDKTLVVSETQEAVDKAGRDSELAYQMTKRKLELRTDIEAAALSNNASILGTTDADYRQAAGLGAWLTTNVERGSGGADGGYSAVTSGLVASATNGTLRAISKTLVDNVIQQTYTAGGNPSVIMLSPYAKKALSGILLADAATAQQRYQATGTRQTTVIGAADMYVSDFGVMDLVPNRQMARVGATIARNAFILEPSKAAIAYLRPFQEEKLAKTGDAEKRVVKTEWTLVVKNEAAHGQIADIYGMTASS